MRLPISRLLQALILWSLSATAWSGTFTVFGPQTYVRASGTPVTVTTNFTVLNPNTQFTLRVHNGSLVDSSTDLVSSTTVTVNGVVIVAPNDLNQNIAEVDKPVTLQASNEIDVQVRGAPGGTMTVDIVGIDNDPPTISAAATPAANAAGWNNTDVTVSFTCADALSGIASCSPAALVSTEGANQIISGTATDNAGNTATAQVSLSIDKTAPVIAVASPVDGSTVATPTLQFSGSVSDALSGVASVSCNGTATLIQAGSFSCSVSLIAGPNSITVSATDVAGNTATKLVSVTLANQPVITDFNPKSGPVGTLVTLTGSSLTLGATTQVTLNQLGGGTIAAPISSASATSIAFVIPAGATTGAVTVTSAGQSATSADVLAVTPASSFSLTAGPASATLLQGKATAYSVTLASTDGFGDLAKLSVSGLPVGATASFSPAQITAGQTSILTVTAPATQPTGNSTLTISAAATVNGISSTQSASVTLSVQPVTTSFFGRVVEADTNETPLPGIVITFLGVDDAAHPTGCSGRTVADAAGNFIFANLPDVCAGRQLVQYNGLTATDGEAYAGVNLAYTLVKGDATGPELVHLPDIQDAETVMVKQNSATDQTFQFKTIPGITVTVYSGTVFTMVDGTQPDPFPFTAVEVPVDRLPDTPVDGPGTLRAFIVAFQPADTNTNQPVAVSFPNFINTPPGVNMELDTLDPVVGDLVKYGTGTVSGDGTQVIPDLDPAHPGHRFGIQHFDWHGPMAPAPNAANPGPDPNGPKPGDPVDAASGLFEFTKTDIQFGGARGQVAIQRTYRTLSGAPGPFGVGTNHNYGYQLNTFSFIQGQGFITLIMPDGNQFQFILQTDGTFTNTTIPMFKGAVLRAAQPNFFLRYKDGTTYAFQNPSTGARVAYLSSITDRNGNVTTMVRGNSADPVQITEIVDPVGRALNFAYDNFDRITSITDPIGRVVSYTYNAQGTLDTVTDAAGGITRYAYDPANRMTSITDPRGITYIQNVYDGNGKVAQQTAADGGVTHFDYTLLNPNSSVILAGSATTTNTSPVLLTVVTDPLGNQTTYHYNAQGFVIDVTDALGEKTIYEREPGTNLLLSVTDPLSRMTSYTYDPQGNVTSITRLAGTAAAVTTLITYNSAFAKITSTVDPLGHSTEAKYDNAGNLVSVTDSLNNQRSFGYDAFGELVSTTDPAGNTTQFAYDSFGNAVHITDPLGRVATRIVDVVGRILTVVNPLGQTTRFQYDPLNHGTLVTDSLGNTISFTYDGNGNLLMLTDSNQHTTSYTYDSMDQLVTRVDALGNPEHYLYDHNGRLTQFTDRRGLIYNYSYDPLNRWISATYGDQSTSNYQYDAGGHLTGVADSITGFLTRTYDGLDRLLSEHSPQGSVTYSYDAAGRRTEMTVAGQPSVSYSYDATNRLIQLGQGLSLVLFSYDADDRRTSLTLPNGIIVTYGYDAASQLLNMSYHLGTSLLGTLTYTYDQAGRRASIGGSFARSGMPGELTTASYNAGDALTEFAQSILAYDANGNLTGDGVNAYIWNARNNLVSISGGISAGFQYDPFGRRVSKTVGKVTTSYLYDGANPVQELTGGVPSANLLEGSVDEYFGRSAPGGTSYFLSDALGSTVALANSAGALQTQYTFDPFGTTAQSGADTGNTFAFTGRELDSTGLYYYRARYYNPQLQRFLSEDPIGLRGRDQNLYRYTFDSPVNGVDPSGLATVNLGGNINISFGPVNIQYSGGIVIDTNGNFGVYNTGGAGAAVNTGVSGSFSLTGGASTGRTICSFGGPFVEYGANAGLGPGGGASGYVGFESDGTPIIGGSVNAGVGGGADAYDDITVTHVTPLFGKKSVCP